MFLHRVGGKTIEVTVTKFLQTREATELSHVRQKRVTYVTRWEAANRFKNYFGEKISRKIQSSSSSREAFTITNPARTGAGIG